jgi:proteasome activator subunit 4
LHRYLSFARYAFAGIPTLAVIHVSAEEWRKARETSDVMWVSVHDITCSDLTMCRNEIPEMIPVVDPLKANFCLTDPDDVRYQYITSLRQRYGDFLHKASVSLRKQGEENTVDAVHMLVRFCSRSEA